MTESEAKNPLPEQCTCCGDSLTADEMEWNYGCLGDQFSFKGTVQLLNKFTPCFINSSKKIYE